MRCFDLDTKRNRAKASDLKSHGDFEVIWGSITEMEQLQPALIDIDAIIHLAAIIPPLSEIRPEFAKKVNVDGMKNLLNGISGLEKPPKFIFASSISTHGPRSPDMPDLTSSMPQRPTDNYTHHKVECENMLRKSSIPWTILRLTAIPPLEISTNMDPMLFEMPLEQKIEFCHTRDVGLAFANSVEADTIGKTLLIGGGPRCQLVCSDFTRRLLDTMGIGMLPENVFKRPNGSDDWFYTSWMDTTESESLLIYQTRTLEDYLVEMKENVGALRYIIRLFSPLIRRMIVRKSPYH